MRNLTRQSRRRRQGLNSGRSPRLPDGTSTSRAVVGGGSNGDIEREGGLKAGELPLLPWARELKAKRLPKDEPYTACLPMGVPRINPYPWKFAMSYTAKGLSHIYQLHETGDAGAHRVIYMDGRQHPRARSRRGGGLDRPLREGPLVSTRSVQRKFWFDSRGTPHSEKLHTIERWTRVNFGRMTHRSRSTIRGRSRVGDAELHGEPDSAGLKDGDDLLEFICLEDNQYGAAAGIQGVGSGR